ncbi:MAG: AMP-binding protein [Actinomycetota bacterium]|nr:AMP-binding protein [Actinomycetota bacterium]
MTTGWNFADVWEAVAGRFPGEPAQRYGSRTVSWAELDRRADGVAAALVDAGLARQAKVAQLLYNAPEYLESVFASFKVGLVPVSVNYRYTGDELVYLLDNADAEAVVFHGSLAGVCDEIRPRLPRVRRWLWVADDGAGACPAWAVPYEEAATSGMRPPAVPRSGDDLMLLYTGGTTGAPKGVMWPQDTLFRMLEELNGAVPAPDADAAAHAAGLARPGPLVLPAAPLMHGTAMWFVLPVLSRGGSVITLPQRSFEPEALLDALCLHRVKGLCIVGDAFARPLVAALDADPERWDLSGLRVVFSSGVSFSAETQAALLRHATGAVVVDSLGSSESGGLARTQARAGSGAPAPRFTVGRTTRVVDETGADVEPGSGRRGRLAVTGHIPLGYYRDPEKTAETFVTIDGVRYVVAGDWAEVEADGTIRLLGRGSVCINTGGEKVYPDEVEVAVKRAAGVRDAVVVGVPDERFGETVVAVIEAEPGAAVDPGEVTAEVRRTLAGYKAPRRVVVVPSLERAPNGKADYRRLRDLAIAALAVPGGG